MRTVDEILASGLYTDRRGRKWKIVRSPVMGTWWGTPHPDDVILILHENKMRLLIERDQHRAACPGLANCSSHPVPNVVVYSAREFWAYEGDEGSLITRTATLPEAMDAARALAVRDV